MKKTILFLALLAMSLLVVACGSNTNKTPDANNNQVNEENKDRTTNNANSTADNNDVKKQPDTHNNDTIVNGADEVAKMDKLDYVEFDLDVNYANHKEYEVKLEKELERDRDGDRDRDDWIEAKIEDELNGVNLAGTAAFEQIYPLVEQLTITKTTTKEEAIQQILDVFKLDADYEEFEVDIVFKDGTKMEFKDKK